MIFYMFVVQAQHFFVHNRFGRRVPNLHSKLSYSGVNIQAMRDANH